MNVNMDKVRNDLEKVNEEIAETEQMLTSLTAQLALLQGRKTDLETFLRMVEDYRATKVTPATVLRPPAPQVDAKHQTAAAAAQRLAAAALGETTHQGTARDRMLIRPAPMTLKPGNDRRQTKIAQRLTEVFGPGDAITAVEAQDKLGEIIDDTKGVTRVHYVSSYLSREADANNGILERIEMGKYRLRQDAKTRLGERIETTPQQPMEEQSASSV